MDFTALLAELERATPFELFRLAIAIDQRLEDPARIQQIKQRLRPGEPVTWFDRQANRLREGEVVEVRRTRVVLRSGEGSVAVPLCSINLDRLDTDIRPASTRRVNRNSLKVGDRVSFENRQGQALFGVVTRLNPKTAGVQVGAARWRVHYSYLSLVIDGERGAERFIEGEIVGRE